MNPHSKLTGLESQAHNGCSKNHTFANAGSVQCEVPHSIHGPVWDSRPSESVVCPHALSLPLYHWSLETTTQVYPKLSFGTCSLIRLNIFQEKIPADYEHIPLRCLGMVRKDHSDGSSPITL